MFKHISAMCATFAVVSTGSMALAQTATSAMHSAAMVSPTMVCRAAAKGETATAKLASGGDLICKQIDMSKVMTVPATQPTTSKADEDAAWQRQLQFLMMEST